MDDPKKEIEFEKPKGMEGKGAEPDIYVMPEKFRGVTLEAKIPQVSVPKPAKAVPERKETPVAPPRPKKKFPWFWAIIIIVILASLAASIFFVLQGLRQAPAEPLAVEEPTPTPAPTPTPPVPPPEEEEEEVPMATEEVTIPATVEEVIPVVPEEPATPEVTIPVEPPEITGGVDADSDGLTDLEEGLYGTDVARPDTDQDGYLDGNEVYHLYNPSGTAPVTLLESGLVEDFKNQAFGYEIYYPAPWVLNQSQSDSVIFTAPTGEFVQVLIQENPQGLGLKQWYLAQSPGVDENDLKEFTNKAGLSGLQSPDRLTAYFQKDSTVYVVSLNLGAKSVIEYRRTYEMILNSFKFF